MGLIFSENMHYMYMHKKEQKSKAGYTKSVMKIKLHASSVK
jgi:hypothetical protein